MKKGGEGRGRKGMKKVMGVVQIEISIIISMLAMCTPYMC